MRALVGDEAWRNQLARIIEHGRETSPRSQDTLEILQDTNIHIDMNSPVVTTPDRKLNYRFMCAEALWILGGDNRLEPLTRFIKRMAKFSDDGETLAGAYGPKIIPQLNYVVSKLLEDKDTRQAVLTIWERNPQPSKDIPCTVSMSFTIRNGLLNQHVYMRSSDTWLGIPYDMFSFACVGLRVACEYNERRIYVQGYRHGTVLPGTLTISPTSSHLYMKDWQKAKDILFKPVPQDIEPVPNEIIKYGRFDYIQRSLLAVREGQRLSPDMWRCVP